jgi:hypothetical protein
VGDFVILVGINDFTEYFLEPFCGVFFGGGGEVGM